AKEEEEKIKQSIVTGNANTLALEEKLSTADKRAKDAEKAIDDKFTAEKSRVDAKELATDKAIADNDKRAKDAEKAID
ncbi:hypothetical protein, partial [Sandaracinomonas limnophila]|uniref:hypothetical protein n=1 Tax=Sandaracinomonas limnophila TaxID=1862386 RepID=UPI0013E327EB